jgi:23S rRNA pseudouridine2605 synthase
MRNNKKSSKTKGDFSKFIQKQHKSKDDVVFEKTERSFPNKVKKIVEQEVTKSEKPLKEKLTPSAPKPIPLVKEKKEAPTAPAKVEPIKLNKYIAHAGICSRRAAADLVKKGDIIVNGKVEVDPAYTIQPGDVITLNGKAVVIEDQKVYILMNKPKNVITTLSDEKGRKTVMDIVGTKYTERLYPVGRLDRMTTGLLLITNDGDLTTKLSHPSSLVKKIYLAELDQPLKTNDLDKIRNGLNLEDGIAQVDDANYSDGVKTQVIITLHIGKNRIVRRIFEHLGYEVVKLDRLYYAGLTKKDLPRGFFRELSKEEVIMLQHFAVKK